MKNTMLLVVAMIVLMIGLGTAWATDQGRIQIVEKAQPAFDWPFASVHVSLSAVTPKYGGQAINAVAIRWAGMASIMNMLGQHDYLNVGLSRYRSKGIPSIVNGKNIVAGSQVTNFETVPFQIDGDDIYTAIAIDEVCASWYASSSGFRFTLNLRLNIADGSKLVVYAPLDVGAGITKDNSGLILCP